MADTVTTPEQAEQELAQWPMFGRNHYRAEHVKLAKKVRTQLESRLLAIAVVPERIADCLHEFAEQADVLLYAAEHCTPPKFSESHVLECLGRLFAKASDDIGWRELHKHDDRKTAAIELWSNALDH